ncbi:protein PSK SIMULATOR 1-like [Salvia miltiorrhiza]|uniref:protein PSK SIMULATOR 1-like n=1 Tax=Salvia miltiorrhiza TaxID=226208 RepID=UPI0025ABC913|nr:protein PSK SIMULATOR 1-like [Salvia miltiorrhiza]
MVGFKHIGWLPEPKKEGNNLGILSFETAKTMSRLISLYKSVSDEEISRLRNDVIRSKGVAFLNSDDEGFLLGLACAERLEDLDRAAAAVARLGKKCSDFGLERFDLVYKELKEGVVSSGKLRYGSSAAERKIRKIERLVAATSGLHGAVESLAEMEVSERKMKQWKSRDSDLQKANYDNLIQKLEIQRREIRNFKEISLWNKSFDKCVDLMARVVLVVHRRICGLFGPRKRIPMKEKVFPHSGPLLTASKPVMVRFYSRKSGLFEEEEEGVRTNRIFHSAGPETVGGSGLALRYANVILTAEKYLDSDVAISHVERESFYEMLPENLKILVRAKLSKNMRCAEEGDALLAEGWRDAVAEILQWLAPVADDTVRWQMERSFEKTRFDARPTALLLQTLHFADREKTEAAIAEILVGLSCVFRFENRRFVHCEEFY